MNILISRVLSQIAALLDCNLLLHQSLECVAKEIGDFVLRDYFLSLASLVSQSDSLYRSLEKQPGFFSPSMIAAIRAGEISSDLSGVLKKLSEGIHKGFFSLGSVNRNEFFSLEKVEKILKKAMQKKATHVHFHLGVQELRIFFRNYEKKLQEADFKEVNRKARIALSKELCFLQNSQSSLISYESGFYKMERFLGNGTILYVFSLFEKKWKEPEDDFCAAIEKSMWVIYSSTREDQILLRLEQAFELFKRKQNRILFHGNKTLWLRDGLFCGFSDFEVKGLSGGQDGFFSGSYISEPLDQRIFGGDCDVFFLGEIETQEDIRLAIRLSNTGIKVISFIRSKSAERAIAWMRDLCKEFPHSFQSSGFTVFLA